MTPLSGMPSLGFTNAEYLGSTDRALPLGSGAPILHNDRPRIFDFNLLPTFNTICLHFDLLNWQDLREEVIT